MWGEGGGHTSNNFTISVFVIRKYLVMNNTNNVDCYTVYDPQKWTLISKDIFCSIFRSFTDSLPSVEYRN